MRCAAWLSSPIRAPIQLSQSAGRPQQQAKGPICARRPSSACEFLRDRAKWQAVRLCVFRPSVHTAGGRPSQPPHSLLHYFPFRQAGLRSTTIDQPASSSRERSTAVHHPSLSYLSVYLHIHLPGSSRYVLRTHWINDGGATTHSHAHSSLTTPTFLHSLSIVQIARQTPRSSSSSHDPSRAQTAPSRIVSYHLHHHHAAVHI